MIAIKDLLVRFDKLLLSGEVKKRLIREALVEVTGIQIKTEEIEIKNNIIFLNIKPIYKNEIFLKRDQLFLKLKESLGKNFPQNIR